MKKTILTIVCIFTLAATTAVAGGVRVNFVCEHIHNTGVLHPRTPVQPPVVYLDDYTLTFESHADFTLQVVSFDDESVVFETSVPSSVSEVQLPSYLTGEYELRLYTDSFLFAGYIDL